MEKKKTLRELLEKGQVQPHLTAVGEGHVALQKQIYAGRQQDQCQQHDPQHMPGAPPPPVAMIALGPHGHPPSGTLFVDFFIPYHP